MTAILGVGKLGGALLAGLVGAGTAPDSLRIVESGPHAGALADRFGVPAAGLTEAAGAADVLVLAVKPADVGALLVELAPAVETGRHLIISVAAGLGTAYLQARLPAGTAVVRAMPNTPILVGEGMTGLAAGRYARPDHLQTATALFAPVSRVVTVPEAQLDAVTALSGSGPAYFFLLAEALADAGVLLGLTRPAALELVAQTAVGAAAMLRDSGDSPAQLREAVSSPGGTTVAALRTFEAHGLRAAAMAAAEAARDRSRQLAAELT